MAIGSWDILLFGSHIGIWTLWTLMIRHSRDEQGNYPYSFVGVILLTELTKLFFCCVFQFVGQSLTHIIADLRKIVSNFHEGIYFAVPAFIYGLYNALFYLNLIFFDPVSYRVLINLRILWSGVLFQIIFRKRLSLQRWVALFLLLVGCAINQIGEGFSLRVDLMFLVSIVVQSLMSSLGGVYNEFLLKKNVEIGMNVKNMYLYIFSIIFYFFFIMIFHWEMLTPSVYFKGYSPIVWGLIFIGAFCGFSTSLFLRHLNIILKEYAHSGEMIVTALISYVLFNVTITGNVLLSMFIVGFSIYFYNRGTTEDVIVTKVIDIEEQTKSPV